MAQAIRKSESHYIGTTHPAEEDTAKNKPWRQKACPNCHHVFKGDEERAVNLSTGRRVCLRCAEKHAEMGGGSMYERATNGTESEGFVDIR